MTVAGKTPRKSIPKARRPTQRRSPRPAGPPPPKRHPYDQWSPDARTLDLIGDKWTLLIVRDLISGPRRFIELQRTLPGISTEQLRSRLNRLTADEILYRERYREVPPRVNYELTERGYALRGVLTELAKWGYEWCWSEPRRDESIDIGAIFRLAPGLLILPKSFKNMLNLTVLQRSKDGEDRQYLASFDRGIAESKSTTIPMPEARSSAPSVPGSTPSCLTALKRVSKFRAT